MERVLFSLPCTQSEGLTKNTRRGLKKKGGRKEEKRRRENTRMKK
jgi:hypothetical protein